MIRLLHNDCLAAMRDLPDDSVHAIVTDPPYGLTSARPNGRSEATEGAVMRGFMGLSWDGAVPGVEVWREALRVLKPGGHLIAFGGTRTYHRLVVNIEDAGFEIRDMLAWLYASGYPKAMNVARAIDESLGVEGALGDIKSDRHAAMIIGGRVGLGKHGGWDRPHMTDADAIESAARRYLPGSPEAQAFDGWSTALKPAIEPIAFARKPLIGTVAENVLAHGCGALNVGACRIPVEDEAYARNCSGDRGHAGTRSEHDEGATNIRTGGGSAAEGRWPANLMHDGSAEVESIFPSEAGAAAPVRGTEPSAASTGNVTGARDRVAGSFHTDTGSAARFFYSPKATTRDRNEGMRDPGQRFKKGSLKRDAERIMKERKANHHPTVKPTELMRELVRLVTPPGGVVLDPFMGSGSTGKAAVLEGFGFIGIELSADYVDIARLRIGFAASRPAEILTARPDDKPTHEAAHVEPEQSGLFA